MRRASIGSATLLIVLGAVRAENPRDRRGPPALRALTATTRLWRRAKAFLLNRWRVRLRATDSI